MVDTSSPDVGMKLFHGVGPFVHSFGSIAIAMLPNAYAKLWLAGKGHSDEGRS